MVGFDPTNELVLEYIADPCYDTVYKVESFEFPEISVSALYGSASIFTFEDMTNSASLDANDPNLCGPYIYQLDIPSDLQSVISFDS